jgi:hypothetical protein
VAAPIRPRGTPPQLDHDPVRGWFALAAQARKNAQPRHPSIPRALTRRRTP